MDDSSRPSDFPTAHEGSGSGTTPLPAPTNSPAGPLPQREPARTAALRKLLNEQGRTLTSARNRLREIRLDGVRALSAYDRAVAFSCEYEALVDASLAFLHNQIAAAECVIYYCEQRLGDQPRLF